MAGFTHSRACELASSPTRTRGRPRVRKLEIGSSSARLTAAARGRRARANHLAAAVAAACRVGSHRKHTIANLAGSLEIDNLWLDRARRGQRVASAWPAPKRNCNLASGPANERTSEIATLEVSRAL